jgi:hypothetical protein
MTMTTVAEQAPLLSVRCSPNPIEDVLTIQYALPTSDRVRVELLALDGRVVATLWNG